MLNPGILNHEIWTVTFIVSITQNKLDNTTLESNVVTNPPRSGVSLSNVSTNHWLSYVKTYSLSPYLTQVSTDHALSNLALICNYIYYYRHVAYILSSMIPAIEPWPQALSACHHGQTYRANEIVAMCTIQCSSHKKGDCNIKLYTTEYLTAEQNLTGEQNYQPPQAPPFYFVSGTIQMGIQIL